MLELPKGAFSRNAKDGDTNLVTKYRPRQLCEILGQGKVTRRLREFTRQPTSHAFLLSGPTGCGKSSAASVLASELGVGDEMGGGLLTVESGEITVDGLRELSHGMRFRPMHGSGWRLCVLEEFDKQHRNAEIVLLSLLENLAPRTVLVGLTNEIERLPARIIHRCEILTFTSDIDKLRPWFFPLAEKIWRQEVGTSYPMTDTDGLGVYAGGASFRLLLSQLQPMVSRARLYR